MKSDYLECGKITRAHGINGGMVLEQYCDNAEIFCSLKHLYIKSGNGYECLTVKSCVPYKSGVLAMVKEFTAPEEVIKYRMKTVYASRKELPETEGRYYIADLIGLPVIDADTNEIYGTLDSVVNRGAQDLYVVKREGKDNALIPAIKEFVKRISLEEGIFIKPIDGLLD